MKFLIVDDNDEMRKIISQTICTKEDKIMECSDGEEAIKTYSEILPDYVIMDIRMKTVNGLVATKLINEKFPDSRIVIVTDYDTPSFRHAALNAGACAFFSKENLLKVKEFIIKKAV